MEVGIGPNELKDFIEKYLNDGVALEVFDSEKLLDLIVEYFDQLDNEFDYELYLAEADDE